MLFYQKGNNSKMGDNSDKKKNTGHLFFFFFFFNEEFIYEISKQLHTWSKLMLYKITFWDILLTRFQCYFIEK